MGSSKARLYKPHKSHLQRVVLYIAIFAIVIVVLAFQYDNVARSIGALKGAKWDYVLMSMGVIVVSYFVMAYSYVLLTWPLLRPWPTLLVQGATGLTNRLLPAGLGSMGLYAQYIHKRGKPIAAASGIVASNNALGFIGNVLVLGTVLLSQPDYLTRFQHANVPAVVYYGAGAGLVIILIGGIIYVRRKHGKLVNFVHILVTTLRTTLRPTWRSAANLLGNMVNTLLFVLAFKLSIAAVGGMLTWSDALIVLSLGAGISAIIPTPAGIGGVEAGLFAGMLALGVPSHIALAAVLLWRAVSCWLPILPGAVIFRIVEKRYL